MFEQDVEWKDCTGKKAIGSFCYCFLILRTGTVQIYLQQLSAILHIYYFEGTWVAQIVKCSKIRSDLTLL